MATTNNQNRTYAAAHFALELDGKDEVGLFRSIEGGSIKADVMTYQNGANYDRWRQLGKPKFEDLKIQCGMAMSKPFYDWISAFFTGEAIRKSGAVLAADFRYVERARREFSQAMIKELTFPKLDGQDKNAALMTVGIAVEEIVFKPGTSRVLQAPGPTEGQKTWTCANFRFRLDGFEQPCKRISKIDSFTIKQNVIEYHMGGARGPIKTPGAIDFPNITFYVPEADAGPFLDHFTRRGVKGEVPGRLTGELTALGTTLKDELFTLSFAGADILNVQPDKSDSGSEEIKQVKVELYTESMRFQYGAKVA